jgi:hypothetical protein
MRFAKVIASAALAACAVVASVPASADVSIAGGWFTSWPAGGAVLSATGPTFAPLGTQASLAVPFSEGSRYALTAEVLPPGPLHLGFGLGVGKVENNGNTGLLLDGLIAPRIAPHLSAVFRFYQGLGDGVGSTGFIGLQYTL